MLPWPTALADVPAMLDVSAFDSRDNVSAIPAGYDTVVPIDEHRSFRCSPRQTALPTACLLQQSVDSTWPASLAARFWSFIQTTRRLHALRLALLRGRRLSDPMAGFAWKPRGDTEALLTKSIWDSTKTSGRVTQTLSASSRRGTLGADPCWQTCGVTLVSPITSTSTAAVALTPPAATSRFRRLKHRGQTSFVTKLGTHGRSVWAASGK